MVTLVREGYLRRDWRLDEGRDPCSGVTSSPGASPLDDFSKGGDNTCSSRSETPMETSKHGNSNISNSPRRVWV